MKSGALPGIVVVQVDAHGKPLHDFDEISRGVLRRQERDRRSGAHRESGDVALEDLPSAVHVGVQIDVLPDAEVGKLRLLEVGVDPQVADRLQGHHLLARLNVVARIDVAAADDAVDFGKDAAIAEIEIGLIEVALGLQDLGLGLLDGGRLADDLFVDAIDVPAADRDA